MSLTTIERVVIARIEGEVDISNAQELGEAIVASMSRDSIGLVLDLSSLQYLDSSGVHLLLGLEGRLRKRRQQLRAVVPEDAPLRAVLELTAVDKTVPLHERPEEAVRAMRARS